ncbi:hypothetical protein A2U01_0028695, partial [Trifolium medium]|nr:hypothetical protein [Trifolium medium]
MEKLKVKTRAKSKTIPVLLDRMVELQREEKTNKLHYYKNLGDSEESSRRTGAEKEGNISNGFLKLPFITPELTCAHTNRCVSRWLCPLIKSNG